MDTNFISKLSRPSTSRRIIMSTSSSSLHKLPSIMLDDFDVFDDATFIPMLDEVTPTSYTLPSLLWPGAASSPHRNMEQYLLTPVHKHPVAMGYSHDAIHTIRHDDPKNFDKVMQDYRSHFTEDLDGGEMNYLQNVFSRDGFTLDLTTPIIPHHPSPSSMMKKASGYQTDEDNFSDSTETSTLSSASPALMPMNHNLKEQCVTFVSASGKVKMICEVQDCTKVAQSRKRCKRHGGGPRCRYSGCTKSSQGKGRCRTHGGGKQCQVPECSSGAQQRGFCSRHGGAKLCSNDGCERHSRGSGLCAHHGGGKRCCVVDCNRSSRISGLCALHKRMSETGNDLSKVAEYFPNDAAI